MPKNILYFTTELHSARFQWVQLPLPTHPDRTFSLSSLPNFYSTMTTLTRTVKPPKQRVRSLYFPPFSLSHSPHFPRKKSSPPFLSCFHESGGAALSLCFSARTKESGRESARRAFCLKTTKILSGGPRAFGRLLRRVSRRVSFAKDGSRARVLFFSLLCITKIVSNCCWLRRR